MHRILLAMGILLAASGLARSHFTMLLPDKASTKKGEPLALVYQWGHPFEHQLFDALPPARFRVIAPDGKVKSLTRALEKIKVKGPDGKEVAAFRVPFTPEERGDYTFLLDTPPIWMPEEKEFLQDTVKVVVHVQAQKGWDADAGPSLQMVPLTRPYGLLPGMVFQARVFDSTPAFGEQRALPQPGLPVFIERYNPLPPTKLPADELITFVTRTDAAGVLTCTLPGPGWWSITAQKNAGLRPYEGTDYPLRRRLTLWIWVDQNMEQKIRKTNIEIRNKSEIRILETKGR